MKAFWECPRCMKLNFEHDTKCYVCRHGNPNYPYLVENLEVKLEGTRRKIGAPPSLFAPFGGAKKPGAALVRKCDHSTFGIFRLDPAHPDLMENRGDKNATEENKKN